MSNNLRQIAKDLRSFVKRCKDVHYSDSLLITFLVTGLLTFAPRLHADVAAEQQEVSAQTYDAITDLRQSFIRARKENEKSLKGAERELAMLLQQGDQVIKSPWASFQFGTGFANNDWGTTYRGRGGKFLEYYRRDNDLTKYVFDKNKHLYGATNLNMPRNQEPNSLTINPANVHEAYKNYTPEKLDNISMPNAVSYNPVIYTSTSSTLTSYVKEAPNAGYTLNLPNPETTATNAKSLGWDATFDRTRGQIRSYDGWDWNTRNQLQDTYTTDLEGHSDTNRGHIENGHETGIPGEVYGAHHSVTNYTWLPQTGGSSGVWYSNLNKPAPNNNAAGSSHNNLNNTYNTPGSGLNSSGGTYLTNGSTGYDGVGSTFSVPFAAQWKALGQGASQTTIVDAIVKYYHDNPYLNVNDQTVTDTTGGNVAGYRTKYNNAHTAAEAAANAERASELAAGHTYTNAQWWNKYNSEMQGALTNNYYTYVNNQESAGTDIDTYTTRRVKTTAGTANAWTWFTQALSAHGGSYDLNRNAATSGGVSARSEALLTDKTMTTKYLDVHIGRTASLAGNSYLKAVDGANVTSTDVDVSIYNGNGAAYVTSLGRTGKATITFSNDNTNSIANFDTTNSVQDNGGLTGSDKNVAFNFQDGFSNESKLVSSEVTVAGPVNVRFRGNNNVVYNVISALGKATIINGKGATASDTDLKSDDLMQWGTQTGGRIFTAGNNNVVYNGYAGVVDAASKLYLSDVQMQGNNNIMVNLQGPTTQPYNIGKAGFFNGEIRLQGAFGGTNAATNSVAVYAASGQNAEGLDIGSHISGGGGTASKDVTVQTLNVAYQNNATGVSVYTINGTGVSVGATTNANNITDGLHGTTPTQRKYSKIKLTDVSTNHIMGYAGGETDDIKGSLIQGKFVNKASRITFLKDVDSMSKAGRVFVAQDGGEIRAGTTAAKVMVRAAGSEAVVAYADGYQSNLGRKNSAFDSKITTVGKIVAADWLTLNNTDYNKNSADANARAYKNIAAYAVNGGQIDMDGETASTTFAETGADTNTDNSLIFGIGAVAKNRGNVKLKNVTIIDNEYGALYARKNSTIEFEGNIVNQNNNSTTGTISASGDGTVNAGTRHAQSISTKNTHTNVSPFYVYREDENDQSNITFTGTTNIDMYDGVLLTGNNYGNVRKEGDSIVREWDYAKDVTRPTDPTEANIWDKAKYRGMGKVTTNILTGNVTIGIVNQATEELKWDSNKIGTSGTPNSSFLQGIGNYAGGMKINNKGSHLIDVTLINDKLQIDEDVNVEDIEKTGATTTPGTDKNDTFNDIKMESTYLTINNGKKVTGDVRERDLKDSKGKTNYQVKNVGLAMGNSLSRWNDVKNANDHTWRKTRKGESGFTNLGTVNFWGGSKDTTASSAPITGLLVNYGTIVNGDGNKIATVKVDHGNAIVGTDGSVLKNMKKSEIIVTGKYEQPSHIATNGDNRNRSSESTATGENYGIVGISDTNEVTYNYADEINHRGVDNSVAIRHEDAKIYVAGEKATGIYAENRNNGAASGVTIDYVNTTAGSTGIDVSNSDVTAPDARGVGIALVNSNTNYANGSANAGGVINLTGANNGAFAGWGTKATNFAPGSLDTNLGTNDIFTGKNGVGIYAESAEINLLSKKFTVETADNGVGLWGMDDTHVATGANHQKTFQYNYNGASNKNGFAMAFGGRNTQITTASNDLDIKFTNKADTKVDLAYEKAESKLATPTAGRGTYKGIAGILVNTNDAGDTVINRGHIEEDSSSKTHVRAYGAVVNKGKFVNWGNIKLNDSLNEQANKITSEDMKKANVGIFANSANGNAGGTYTTIENHGDITIGDSTNDKNIGSWAIYGYNVITGAKADGSKSQITVNKNNNGIYSGDGDVSIKQTKILVGNDTVMGHVQTTSGVSTTPGAYPINRQTQYANPNNLLSKLDTPRERDSVIGVYIDNNQTRTNRARNVDISADMDIDRFSYGIVMAEKNGGAATNVTIGSPTEAPTIRLAYSTNNNAGGHVKSTKPTNPKVPEEVYEQGNSVYYYSLDTESKGKSYANVTMDGDYNTAYYTRGAIDNYGTIDLRSRYDVENQNNDRLGFGNIGVFSSNTNVASTNYGTITTGMSDTINMRYSAAMAAGRNVYKSDGSFDRTKEEGYIVNRGTINVKEKEGIGMFATGHGSKALNYGTINLEGESSIGMYLDRGAIGENHGTITGNANNLSGVVAINGGYIKNYGTINVTGTGSYGIVTDGSKFIVDANGNPTEVLSSTDPRYSTSAAKTAGQTNGKGGTDLYGGTESSIEEGTTGNPKTTGVGTTITAPDIVPITKVSVDGVDTPVFNVESDAANPGQWARNISVTSSIQTGGTRIIDLYTHDEWGNPAWRHRDKNQLSEVTRIGMYVDTSGVRYTNPINGIENLPKLSKVDLYFGPEATMYTNSKAIRIGDKVDEHGNIVAKSNILKPFNDALNKLPGGAKINPLSASLTWQVLAKISDDNQLREVYMSKVPYHSFAFDDDKSLVNFTNNLDNIYEIARPGSPEKIIFNKLNSLGNGEGHILAQAFDQMRGHIYGGVQQRIKATSDIIGGEIKGLRNDSNGSKDSNKFKAFGQRNEFKTDTAGMPDWYSNAGGFAYVHEDETVRLGESSGWYAGVVNNYFTFKDLSKSYENQAMAKVGAFKQIPLDENGTLTLNLGGDGFVGRTDTKRRFWVVDQEFRAKASYYTYGAGANVGLEKAFVINEGFSIVPNIGIKAEYGRFSGIHETGDMALNVKSDDYISVKPNAGIDFRYSQPVFKKTNFTAALGFTYENEIGKVNDINNEARIVGAWTDYYTIRGDKEDKKGNFKSHLNLGLDNGRLGFTVNTGYETKGHNFNAGLGLKVLY
ncbi:hypothetical protein JMUB3935_2000 [Leptotrichia trevisanii]|uniref:Autotransporter domain-containing protein n=1 Tax=Leptotrichia trevisanii TaxID=109328 RepID=A0A510KMR1_9FUSO|nr:autotransporter-associated N-terminal domain-containing protein [Leptotrichia trevisanii]BBM53020.1 hypothetical protein JMUB3935_2000 [Leptotrichia trevisanii]